jgi:hypothetical protein
MSHEYAAAFGESRDDTMPPMDLATALQAMSTRLQDPSPAFFYVALVGYWIDGEPYAADMLTVSQDATPNLEITAEGLVCDALFPSGSLDPATVAARPHVTVTLDGRGVDLVRVQLMVKREDIWALYEIREGQQLEWFKNFDVLSRKTAFGQLAPSPLVPRVN